MKLSITYKNLNESISVLEKARMIATQTHFWQTRKTGDFYLYHLLRVFKRCITMGYNTHIQIIALLHDVIEDSKYPEKTKELIRKNFRDGDKIIKQLNLITHKKNDNYPEYVLNIWKKSPNVVFKVKMMDMLDNLKNPNPNQFIKYKNTIKYLINNGVPIKEIPNMILNKLNIKNKIMKTLNNLNECVIVAGTINNNFIMAKNRDRMYKPIIYIIHKIINNVEVCFFYDKYTGWAEGMNEFGIGIVNTALMVGRDEQEKKIVKLQGTKSKDGVKIIKALTKNNIKSALKSIIKNSVKGHTFIGNKQDLYLVEMTSKHEKPFVAKRNPKGWYVRTNHGFYYPDAGYTEGNKYLSSKIRKVYAEKIKFKVKRSIDVLRALRKQYFDPSSQLNMRRSSDDMYTSSQILLNLSKLKFIFYPILDKIEEYKIINQLPKDYEPKINIEIIKK